MKLLLLVELDVDTAELEKLNRKRQRQGRAVTTGVEEALNTVGVALQHNYLFDSPRARQLTDVLQPNEWMHGCGHVMIFESPEDLGSCLQCQKATA